jgi:exopolysaccharide biosynthesis polyprenyl glycosylphosphotransferase
MSISPREPKPADREPPSLPHLVQVPLGSIDRDVRARRPGAWNVIRRLDTPRRVGRIASLMVLDIAGIGLGILTALLIKSLVLEGNLAAHNAWETTRSMLPFASLVAVLLFARSSLYADRAARPGLSSIVACLFQTMIVSVIFALVSGQRFSSYYLFYGSLFFCIVYVGSIRAAYESITGFLLRKAGYERRAVLVGTGHHIEAVGHALQAPQENQVNVVGFISLTPRPDNGLRSLGKLRDLNEIIEEHRIDEVIIADPDFPGRAMVDLVDRAQRAGVRVRIAPSTMDVLVQRADFVPGQSLPLFELRSPRFEGFDFVVKRVFDIVVSALTLLVLSPLLLAMALAIKFTSRGSPLYRSVRPGIGGTPFDCLKFRTMYIDAEMRQAALESQNEATGALFKIRDDPRVTPVGRLLRRFSLDELPQLWNVLRGQMSLVGPRPLPVRDFERLEEWHKKRYLVLPGMTGLWQVSGRSDLDFDDLVRLDFLYLERWSVSLDLTILLKTIPAVLGRRGSY